MKSWRSTAESTQASVGEEGYIGNSATNIYIYTEEDGIETMSNKNVVVVSVYHCALYQRVSV